jgi:hypothetical protein
MSEPILSFNALQTLQILQSSSLVLVISFRYSVTRLVEPRMVLHRRIFNRQTKIGGAKARSPE